MGSSQDPSLSNCVIMIMVIVMNLMMIKDHGHSDEHDDGRGHEGDYDNDL